MIAAYLTVPVYASSTSGSAAATCSAHAGRPGPRATAAARSTVIPDELVDDLVVHGPLQACRERVAEYQAAGLDTPVIGLLPAPDVDLARAIRGLAPA